MARRPAYEEAIRIVLETEGDEELKQLASGLSDVGKSSSVAADQAQLLMDELDKLATTSNNIKKFTTLKAAIAETGDELAQAKTRLAALGSELDRTDQPTKKLQTALSKAAAEVENLSKLQNRQQVALQKTAGALRAAGIDTDKLASAYADLQDEFASFSRRAGGAAEAMQRTARDSKAAAGGVSTLDRAAAASSKSLAAIASRLTLVSGAATAAISSLAAISGATLFTGAVRSAVTLEDALSLVKAATGASAEEMERLKAAAEGAGASTRFSTLEAAQGLNELARATGSADEAIAALPAALNLAAAGQLDVAQASQIVVTALTQFGLGFDKAGKVADLFQTEAASTTDTVSELGLAMSYAAPLAAQLGFSLEDTTVILGALAKEGFKGERAGTALRNAFSELLDPASEFAQALREIGIESTDFSAIMLELAKKGDIGRDAILKLDAAATPAILSLAKNGGASLRSLQAAMGDAAGSAAIAADQMRNNLGGAFESIKDTFDRTRRSLVEPLLEPLRGELFALASELEAFAQSPEFDEIRTALKDLFTEAAGAARELVQEVDFAELAKNIRSYLGEAGESIGEFKENLGLLVETVQLVGDGVSLVFNGIQASVLLVAGAFAKVVSAAAHIVDGLTAPTRALFEFLGVIKEGQGDFSEFAGAMNAVGDEFGGRFVTNADAAIDAAQRLGGAVPDAANESAEALDSLGAATARAASATVELEKVTVVATDALAGQAMGAVIAADTTDTATANIESSAQRLKKAFADMGITSQAELRRAADATSKNFDLIREAVAAGEATAEDARAAFSKYAEAARAAVANSDVSVQQRVDGELRVKGAILGNTASLDDMGKAGVSAGQSIAAGANVAAAALQNIDRSAGAAASSTGDVGNKTDEASKFMGEASKEGEKFALANYAVSDSAAAAYMALNKYAGTSDIWRTQINGLTHVINEQGDALVKQLAQLEAANEQFDELAGRRKELSAQYDLLGAADIERLVQAEARLEQNRKRASDEAARQRLEQLRAAQEQPDVQAQPAGLTQPNEPLVIEFKTTVEGAATAKSMGEADMRVFARRLAPMIIDEVSRARAISIKARLR